MQTKPHTASTEKRVQTRFEVDASVLAVAGQTTTGFIETVGLDGRALNVSASGALISFEQPVDYERIWIRLAIGDRSLSECIVVREDSRPGHPNCYGVQFACLWTDKTLSDLLSTLQ